MGRESNTLGGGYRRFWLFRYAAILKHCWGITQFLTDGARLQRLMRNTKTHLALLLVISGSDIGLGQTNPYTTSFDVFPLKRQLDYIYDYYTESTTTWLVWVQSMHVDSGSVEYIVRDSLPEDDSVLTWNIEERKALWHRIYTDYDFPYQDTSFWTYDTSIISLHESLSGLHELSASDLVWNFPISHPDTTSTHVHRFSDSSRALASKLWSIKRPDCGGGDDSLLFSESSGLFLRKASSFYGGCHNTHTSWDLMVRLRGNPFLSVLEPTKYPSTFVLEQNYPNPFNPRTQIDYILPKSATVSLRLYDLLGREVKTLAEGPQTAGAHSVILNSEDLSSGVYFYRLYSGESVQMRKLAIVK